MEDRPKSSGGGGRRNKSGTRLAPPKDPNSANYKRLEELKEIMGQRHVKVKKQEEEVKLLT